MIAQTTVIRGEGITPHNVKHSQEINVSMQGGANKILMSQQFCNIVWFLPILPKIIPFSVDDTFTLA